MSINIIKAYAAQNNVTPLKKMPRGLALLGLGERRLRPLCIFLHHRWSTVPGPLSVSTISRTASSLCIRPRFTAWLVSSRQIFSNSTFVPWGDVVAALPPLIWTAPRVRRLRPSRARLKPTMCGFGLVAVWMSEGFEKGWCSTVCPNALEQR
ncbi:hypothetical protein RchiOBHm_Chr3g0458981 [Rosa chinensis]|uniref:Uncharacterized protein n=1 Tax=Rosa chinensis TaxID=74649 RepID=A0A2P6R831_ROSCH|nr:hypothetical protein RchiOBHm_Chr3g0458981 [Rosa chinensis]